MKKALALALLLLAVPLVHAQIWCGITQHPGEVVLTKDTNTAFESGNSLHEMCATAANLSRCFGYIIGVSDVLQSQNTNGACLPKGATAGQVIDVVKKYLTDHPETRHFTATSEIEAALTTAFPCSRGTT